MSAHGKDAVRLCEHIVRQAFGDVVCRVASTLLNRGRLASYSVSRLSGLPRPTTLAALTILMQQNLVQSNGASIHQTGEEEMYEFDVSECLLRLRWGRMLAITQERFGQVGVEVVRQVMLYGKLKSQHIISACGSQHDAIRSEKLTETIITLIRAKFLQPTAPELQILRSDQQERRFIAKRDEKRKLAGTSMLSAVEIANLRDEANWEVQQEREALRSMEKALKKSERQGKKKKTKDGDDGFDYSIRPEANLRVNYDRYGVLIRDELIAKAANDRWNRGADAVVKAILAAALDDDSEMNAVRTGKSVTVNEMMERIPHDEYPYLTAGMTASSSKNPSDTVRQYLAIMSGDDLAGGSGSPFLSKVEGNSPTYTVEIEAICVKLRAGLMMELVREKLGMRPARVLATVAKAQKITEQAVRNIAMMPLKEVRMHLAHLQSMSLIETSEIPKNPGLKKQTMTAASEHHHWGIDLPRAYNVLVASVYKTLGNILQRRSSEKERRKAALAREQQAFARGLDRSVMTAKDQEDLADLDDVVRKLALAEARCEMVVFILRDLPGWPTRKAIGG